MIEPMIFMKSSFQLTRIIAFYRTPPKHFLQDKRLKIH